LGHRGVIISPFEFRCSDPAWERFWDAAEATGLPVSFHIGHGTSQVRVAPGSWELAAFSAVGPIQLDEPLAMMICSGVLQRPPPPDSTFPHSREAIAHAFQGLDPTFVEKVTATNCARLYGFAP